jgi:hypothetical protein
MSARTVLPQCSRPGISRWPGFLRKNVTVRSAHTALPRTSPVAPSMPEGISTATTGILEPFSAATRSPAVPSTGRDSPAPNIASTARSCPSSTSVAAGTTSPFQRPAICGGVALQAIARPEQRDPHRPAGLCQQPCRDEPVTAVVARPGEHHQRPHTPALMTARATARPAVSIRSSDATPRATASRSAAAISSGRRSAALWAPDVMNCLFLGGFAFLAAAALRNWVRRNPL